jgi:hypothetical protein
MSIALYRYRLFWDGRRGALRCGHHVEKLAAAPVLPGVAGVQVEEIDYAPEVHVAQLRESGGAWREMSPAEVAGAETLLARLAPAEAKPHAALPLAAAA